MQLSQFIHSKIWKIQWERHKNKRKNKKHNASNKTQNRIISMMSQMVCIDVGVCMCVKFRAGECHGVISHLISKKKTAREDFISRIWPESRHIMSSHIFLDNRWSQVEKLVSIRFVYFSLWWSLMMLWMLRIGIVISCCLYTIRVFR